MRCLNGSRPKGLLYGLGTPRRFYRRNASESFYSRFNEQYPSPLPNIMRVSNELSLPRLILIYVRMNSNEVPKARRKTWLRQALLKRILHMCNSKSEERRSIHINLYKMLVKLQERTRCVKSWEGSKKCRSAMLGYPGASPRDRIGRGKHFVNLSGPNSVLGYFWEPKRD